MSRSLASGRASARLLAGALCLGALAAGIGAQARGALEPGGLSRPDSTVRAAATMHQLRSSDGRPYTLFEYAVPTRDAVPHILAIDDQDHVWFSESGGRFARNFIDLPPGNRIGRLDGNGDISEWILDSDGTSPMGIVFDRHGDLWVCERLGNRITRLRRGGGVDRYPIPTANAWPTGIAVDSRGRIWFTETKGDRLGMIDAANGKLQEYPLPVAQSMTTGIAIDARDQVWIAERDANVIGRFDAGRGRFDQFPLPTADAKPCALAVDAAGTVWFSQRNGGKIGTLREDGAFQEFALPDRFSGPFLLVADKRGDIWFSELFGNRITRFDPHTQRFEGFPIPTGTAHPAGLAVDSKGNVWFAQQSANKIGVIVRTDLSYMGGSPKAAAATAASPSEEGFSFREWEVPTPRSIPGIVGVDRHDTVWFTQMGGGWVGPGFPPGPAGSKVGYIRDGQVFELATPTSEAGPTSLAIDPCGDDVWVTLRAANKIARVRGTEVVEYAIPVPAALPVGIAVDYDHNVWIALSDVDKLARFSPSGEWRVLDLPESGVQPRTVYVDPRNEVWFAEKVGNHVGRVDRKSWAVERWQIPTRVAWPLSLISDRDGNLWFAEMRGDKLAMLDRETKRFVEYALPVQSAPFKLLYDPENSAMWISTVFYNAILRFDLEHKRLAQVYKVPSEGAWIGGLDRDSRHCIWFSEQFANRIGRLCVDGVSSPATAAASGGSRRR